MEETQVTVPDVVPLVRMLYQGAVPCTRNTGAVGGHLHIVLDDGNVKDSQIKHCLKDAEFDHCMTCIRLANLLLQMTKTQRLEVHKRHHA